MDVEFRTELTCNAGGTVVRVGGRITAMPPIPPAIPFGDIWATLPTGDSMTFIPVRLEACRDVT